jgi:hypothetical protein
MLQHLALQLISRPRSHLIGPLYFLWQDAPVPEGLNALAARIALCAVRDRVCDSDWSCEDLHRTRPPVHVHWRNRVRQHTLPFRPDCFSAGVDPSPASPLMTQSSSPVIHTGPARLQHPGLNSCRPWGHQERPGLGLGVPGSSSRAQGESR